ncbi:MAG TPA: imidazoleglycerol-phosphate dehydratase [Longimicrobiales bacterium]|nr:imidazoleglycerol-phosphate dehydratase [Longimicrobiales bacterium]
MSTLTRETRETRVRIALHTEPQAEAPRIATTEPFLDHMLVTLARYAGIGLEVEAAGDLRHHLVEDVGITLGMALRRATPAASGRYGSATVPMDDALVHAALDLGGRFWYEGPVPSSLYDHFLRSFAEHAAMTLHVRALRGTDRHHVVEAAFKAVGMALRQALTPEGVVFSTKGAVDVRWEENG